MTLQEGIEKVLNALAKDKTLQKAVKDDPEKTIQDIVGDDLDKYETDKIIRGCRQITSDSQMTMAFSGLLGVGKCIPGLSQLLAANGGLSLLLAYIEKGLSGGTGMPMRTLGILSELLSSQEGVAALTRLIGSSPDMLPDLNAMMALFSGSSQAGGQPSGAANVGQPSAAKSAAENKAEKKDSSGDSIIDAIGSIFGI